MKSLMITKYGDINSSLEEQEIAKPALEENQILIKAYSSSFNPIDFKIVRGDFKAMGKVTFPIGTGRDVAALSKRSVKILKNLKRVIRSTQELMRVMLGQWLNMLYQMLMIPR